MSGAPGLRFYLPQVTGPMSTAADASQISIKNEGLSVYFFVSTFNSVNPTKPYRFGSDTERMKYNIGKEYAVCGANVQNQ